MLLFLEGKTLTVAKKLVSQYTPLVKEGGDVVVVTSLATYGGVERCLRQHVNVVDLAITTYIPKSDEEMPLIFLRGQKGAEFEGSSTICFNFAGGSSFFLVYDCK